MFKNPKISDVSRQVSRRVAIRLSVFGFIFLSLVCVSVIFRWTTTQADFLAESISQNLAHDIQVGDQFQIARKIDSFVSSHHVNAAWVFSVNPEILIASRSSFSALKPETKGWLLHNGLTLSYFRKYPIVSAFREDVGSLIVAIPFPVLWVLGLCFLFVGVFSIISSVLFRAFDSVAVRFAKPIGIFATEIERFQPQESKFLNLNRNESFYELDIVASRFSDLWLRILATKELEKNLLKEKVVIEIAKQVSHDIRSPVSALNLVEKSSAGLSDDERLIMSTAIQRIRSIAEDFLKTSKDSVTTLLEIKKFSDLISTSVQEKKIEYSESNIFSIEYVSSDVGTVGNNFIRINVSEFQRIFSNLINNSIEAKRIDCNLKISIDLKIFPEKILFIIADNGKGIPIEILNKIRNLSFSFGKNSGHGLGIQHAREKIESWGGLFSIDSLVDQWTKIEIELPVVT